MLSMQMSHSFKARFYVCSATLQIETPSTKEAAVNHVRTKPHLRTSRQISLGATPPRSIITLFNAGKALLMHSKIRIAHTSKFYSLVLIKTARSVRRISKIFLTDILFSINSKRTSAMAISAKDSWNL